MLSNNIAFELDSNAIFLRKQNLTLHHCKLFSIQNRKNKYLHTEGKNTQLSRNKYSELQYSISKDNLYFNNKLRQISHRKNKSISNNKPFDNYLKTKILANNAIFQLKRKLHDNFVNDYKKRILSVESVVDNEKFNRDFLTTRSVFNHLKKIQPHQSAVNVFKSYTHYRANRMKSETKKGKKELPYIQTSSYMKNNL